FSQLPNDLDFAFRQCSAGFGQTGQKRRRPAGIGRPCCDVFGSKFTNLWTEQFNFSTDKPVRNSNGTGQRFYTRFGIICLIVRRCEDGEPADYNEPKNATFRFEPRCVLYGLVSA